MVCKMVYNGESMISYLKINFRFKRKKHPVMWNNKVNKGIFYFFGCQNLSTHEYFNICTIYINILIYALYVCMCVCMYVCMCVCVCMYVFEEKVV